jgi:2-oxoglutarate dehydrogenase E1 component
MFNNRFDLLEPLLENVDADAVLDNRAEDHRGPASAAGPSRLTPGGAAGCDDELDFAYKQSRVDSLLWAYRDVGYLYADLNPLGESYSEKFTSLSQVKEQSYHRLTLEEFGLSEADLDTEFVVGGGKRLRMSLRGIIEKFRTTYCGYIGVEFLHIQNKKVREWLISRLESGLESGLEGSGPEGKAPANERRRIVLEDLVASEEFERFLNRSFVGQKRFSIEGSEAVIPALHFLLDSARAHSIERVVIGTAHRGRLTILNRILGKRAEEIFYLFEPHFTPGAYGSCDDVKYHIGYSGEHVHADGTRIAVTMSPNASHLESTDPVVEGRARGLQDLLGDADRRRVLPILVHGDAAMPGQGVLAETLNLAKLEGYTTGGTIHVVINNQIGFTTPSRSEHSSLNPTDVAKADPVPIFHVNGDHPDEVLRVMRIALDYRQAFGADVVVDIFCYRKYGHNEGDEPAFTHPFMYDLIRSHPSVAALYGEACLKAGVVAEGELQKMREDYVASLDAALLREREETRGLTPPAPAGLALMTTVDTGVDPERLKLIMRALSRIPEGMHIHDKLKAIVIGKLKLFEEKGRLDWAAAEALAFGSLLVEGVPVRLSGEDSERGTFSQRHFAWWEAGERTSSSYVPLDHIEAGQRAFALYDSPLSEFAVLGFEYGFAVSYPEALVMWEAQFGDFSNGAQVIIDNYLAAGEAKWGQKDGLVLLLPHGFEGQGPEHSSAQLERFLSLCAEGNLRVCVPSTPAQYFHLLRSQAKDPIKKPLVVMTPKSLLRSPAALSSVAELSTGSFLPVLTEAGDAAIGPKAQRLILCSGKVYYDLVEARQKAGRKDIAIARLERLYPFPAQELRALLAGRDALKDLVWVQEEPENRGAWRFVKVCLEASLPEYRLRYIGRKASASPATGSHSRHEEEQAALLAEAVGAEYANGSGGLRA